MNYRTCTSLLEIKPADPRPVPTALHAHRTTSTTRTEHDTVHETDTNWCYLYDTPTTSAMSNRRTELPISRLGVLS